MKKLKDFKPLLKLVKEDKGRIIFAGILIFISEFSYIILGYINGSSLEAITNQKLGLAVILMATYALINFVFGGYVSIKARNILQKVENKLSRKLSFMAYKKSLDIPAYAYEKYSSGEIINRISNDTNALNNSFISLLKVSSSVIGSLAIIVYILFNSWLIALIIILFLIILYYVLKHYRPLLKNIHSNKKTSHDRFSSLTIETVRGIREIKTLGIKNNLLLNMKGYVKDLFKKTDDEIQIKKNFDIITSILKIGLEGVTFTVCIILLYFKEINLTFLIAMTYYIYRYMWLIEDINELTEKFQEVTVSLGRVNEILNNKLAEEETYGEINLENSKGVIEFKNVKFNYPNEPTILDNFNLKLVPNKKIAIVGKSGQGKSTIFNLLTRVFDPVDGEILLDGVKLDSISENSLRKEISIIRQEPFIFNRTIKDNFLLVDKKLTLEEIRNYTKRAYLDDYIMSLPNKYDTILGEGGVNLSGGQKQRLAIARTLAKNSKVILFDEATSALDNSSQDFIKKTIDDLVKDHTVIIVAHRLSTIMDADIIYVVDKGKIVDSGKHNELLEKSPIYNKLYNIETL